MSTGAMERTRSSPLFKVRLGSGTVDAHSNDEDTLSQDGGDPSSPGELETPKRTLLTKWKDASRKAGNRVSEGLKKITQKPDATTEDGDDHSGKGGSSLPLALLSPRSLSGLLSTKSKRADRLPSPPLSPLLKAFAEDKTSGTVESLAHTESDDGLEARETDTGSDRKAPRKDLMLELMPSDDLPASPLLETILPPLKEVEGELATESKALATTPSLERGIAGESMEASPAADAPGHTLQREVSASLEANGLEGENGVEQVEVPFFPSVAVEEEAEPDIVPSGSQTEFGKSLVEEPSFTRELKGEEALLGATAATVAPSSSADDKPLNEEAQHFEVPYFPAAAVEDTVTEAGEGTKGTDQAQGVSVALEQGEPEEPVSEASSASVELHDRISGNLDGEGLDLAAVKAVQPDNEVAERIFLEASAPVQELTTAEPSQVPDIAEAEMQPAAEANDSSAGQVDDVKNLDVGTLELAPVAALGLPLAIASTGFDGAKSAEGNLVQDDDAQAEVPSLIAEGKIADERNEVRAASLSSSSSSASTTSTAYSDARTSNSAASSRSQLEIKDDFGHFEGAKSAEAAPYDSLLQGASDQPEGDIASSSVDPAEEFAESSLTTLAESKMAEQGGEAHYPLSELPLKDVPFIPLASSGHSIDELAELEPIINHEEDRNEEIGNHMKALQNVDYESFPVSELPLTEPPVHPLAASGQPIEKLAEVDPIVEPVNGCPDEQSEAKVQFLNDTSANQTKAADLEDTVKGRESDVSVGEVEIGSVGGPEEHLLESKPTGRLDRGYDTTAEDEGRHDLQSSAEVGGTESSFPHSKEVGHGFQQLPQEEVEAIQGATASGKTAQVYETPVAQETVGKDEQGHEITAEIAGEDGSSGTAPVDQENTSNEAEEHLGAGEAHKTEAAAVSMKAGNRLTGFINSLLLNAAPEEHETGFGAKSPKARAVATLGT